MEPEGGRGVGRERVGELVGVDAAGVGQHTNRMHHVGGLVRTAADGLPEDLHALWAQAKDRARAATNEALTAGGLESLARRPLADGSTPCLRWILVHMIEEYARHNGHADLLREAIDGQTGE